MTNLIKAAEMALEALEGIHPGNMTPMAEESWNKAAEALRQALTQPEQEPVAYKCTIIDDEHPNGIPIEQWGNAARPKRKWVGLSDQEIENLWNQHESRFDYYSFSCDIEAKLKEKNT